ncbi:hypothetical protein PNEG_00048 [Pneumocystis murina B123]|uniref:Mitochondrial import inner membrane translocase subunit n=1 Tax=Pneumocystis murina (strain B123) TaxID=1069680 RepID=M7NWD4_PNEMU|nr:hypothetical protein PNEG_00048 [Pneumocystis murina B123]EMR11607.1 hypothetical protein PNEG_00048 [Pneumocystis murina B123]
MESLNQKEQATLQGILEAKQMKDFMKMYSNLVNKCFSDCINEFVSKSLNSKEETCVIRCANKFLKHSERVGQRFTEINVQQASKIG